MRIALCGTHSSGKTTLANALSEKLKIPIASLTVDSVFQKYCGLPAHIETRRHDTIGGYLEALDVKERFNFSKAACVAQVEAEDRAGESYIADNSLVQQLALMLYYSSFGIREDQFGALYEETEREAVTRYNDIFYLPVHGAPKPDGIRPANRFVCGAIDMMVNGVLDVLRQNRAPVDIHKVPPGYSERYALGYVMRSLDL